MPLLSLCEFQQLPTLLLLNIRLEPLLQLGFVEHAEAEN